MIRTDFSRSFLRMGYDVSEVLTFLGDVERTLTGQETDPEKVVTAHWTWSFLRSCAASMTRRSMQRSTVSLTCCVTPSAGEWRAVRTGWVVTFTLRRCQLRSRLPFLLSMLISARLRPSNRFFVP